MIERRAPIPVVHPGTGQAAGVGRGAAGQRVPASVHLPASELADHVQPPGDPVGRDCSRKRPRVLVVEPSKHHATALSATLQEAGFTVVQAASAEDALAHTRRRPTFDLIMAELQLPRQSGLGLLSRVRQSCPATPFFLLTGQPDVGSSVCAFALGATEYLIKPVEEARLVALCRAAVAGASRPAVAGRPRSEAPRHGL